MLLDFYTGKGVCLCFLSVMPVFPQIYSALSHCVSFLPFSLLMPVSLWLPVSVTLPVWLIALHLFVCLFSHVPVCYRDMLQVHLVALPAFFLPSLFLFEDISSVRCDVWGWLMVSVLLPWRLIQNQVHQLLKGRNYRRKPHQTCEHAHLYPHRRTHKSCIKSCDVASLWCVFLVLETQRPGANMLGYKTNLLIDT